MRSRGIALALASAVAFAIMGYFAKHLSRQMPPSEVIFFRGSIATLVLLPWCWSHSDVLARSEVRFLLLRAFAGAGSALCYFWTISKTSIANARAMADISPILVVLLGWRFLGERPTTWQLGYVLLGLVGTSLLGLPGASTCPFDAWFIGITGAVFASLSYFSLRKISNVFPTQVTVFFFMFVMALVSLFFYNPQWGMPTYVQTISLLVVSIAGLVAQLLMTCAYARLPAFMATALGLSTLPLAAFTEYFLDSTVPSLFESTAYLLILLSVLFNAGSNTKRTFPDRTIATPTNELPE